jgi:hypothetical protein
VKHGLIALLVACGIGCPTAAQGHRYAILVGNNHGRGLDVSLRYAEADARRLALVLTDLGGFEAARIRIILSPSAAEVEQSFAAVTAEIGRTHDASALVLFYYSGHADAGTLHLGETSLDLGRLRDLLAASNAAVRLGIIDACGAGALTTRQKGLTPAPAFMASAPPELVTRGQVIVAAVSASEQAQESDELKGSFFTTSFVSGLRGAADRSGTGRVTLDEAYRYAYAQTVRATLVSSAGAQHPSYDVSLAGQGELVLTEPRLGRSRLIFRPERSGEFVIFTPSGELVAEVFLDAGATALLALDPGDYEVHKRGPDALRFARVHVEQGEERELREARMQRLDYVALARKGVSPRLAAALGYASGLLASPDGTPLLRLQVDLEGSSWVLSPRLTVGRSSWSASAAQEQVDVSETFAAAGLAATHPWERGGVEAHLGVAGDALLVVQTSYGNAELVAAGDVAALAGAGLRVSPRLALTASAELGLLTAKGPTALAVRPYLMVVGGVGYDL